MTTNRKPETPFSSLARRPDNLNSARTFRVTASISFHVGATSSADLFSTNAFKYDLAAESCSEPASSSTIASILLYCVNASAVRFCAASSTALRYSALRCRRMAVNWLDFKSECCSRILSASPRGTEPCWPVSPDRNNSAVSPQIKQPFHVIHPHRPGLVQHDQFGFAQAMTAWTAAGYAM